MGKIEATTNIVVALINNHFVSTPSDVVEAFKTIYKAVENPDL